LEPNHIDNPKIEISENINVLVAEDEVMNYMYLEEVLKQAKANVTWCKNGQEAVDTVLNDKMSFDIILMDVKMPLMNGYEATKIIKKYKPEIPVIIQTAYAMPDEKKRGFESGCDEYLEKPVRQTDLLKVIKKFI